MEDIAVAQCQIAILNKLGEELVALQALLADLLNDDLDDAEQVAALGVGHRAELDGELHQTAVRLDGHGVQLVRGLQQSLAQNFLAVSNAVFLAQSAKIAIDCKVDELVINLHSKTLLNGKRRPNKMDGA